ncbi:MAG TPA: pseudouridine-5'-phosphate glycosidase [Clostridia bacterium]|jgi:pseudouridine-5'-phosphate glycosidase|nr:pseudouridine-5'-phosphate glycosidase [Clostridiaceae bacterium]HOF25962.1 pseudouridine-5'-phosphate glycosidase [Clostridia bacterium]HOM33595.1 pseudouridine-5'-phosphate glycosidase [Clostridia bacterium]HOR88987.1 pseudouridine-5'-phosphate glycosidase [Clostridia bacterium]HOT70637.1 pseudouridine-5'-phosphate glycosidase [Clostridia bacterium]
MISYIDYSEEVKKAKKEGQPVVALESTIISHGMPYPKNVETALMCEDIIRKNNAVPATIAVIDGRLKAGLSHDEIEYLAKAKGILKMSRRDLPAVVAQKQDGAATVAATMIIAALAGIKVFATGGIGGVHREASHTFDISADLQELAKTSVAVVCAGVKSILDIGLTLEYLETMGVPVLGYQTDKFPAFYTDDSGFGVDYVVNDAEHAADIIRAKWGLGLQGGVVVANPIPKQYSMDKKYIDNIIKEALAEADKRGIKGKKITPFLLDKIKELTAGESLDANIKLVLNNSNVAAKIAYQLCK